MFAAALLYNSNNQFESGNKKIPDPIILKKNSSSLYP